MATFELDRLAVEDAKTAILRPLDKGAILVDESTGTEYKAKDNISQTGMSITKMLTDGLLVGAGSGGGGGVGLPGPAGPAGQDGVDGKDGAVGPHGPQGPAGTAGTNGTDGAKGPKGDDGAKGADGATGAHGPKGDKGDTGPRGPAGSGGGPGGLDPVDQAKIDHLTVTADINLDDLDPDGLFKLRKTIDVQDLTTAAVQDPGTYFLKNTDEMAVISPNISGETLSKVVLAVNAKGELRAGRTKGSTMVWGPAAGAGPAGPAGAIGPKGPKGDTGAAGPHGAQGPKGDAGVAGAKGDAGDDGSGLFQFDYKVKVGTVDATPSKGYVAFDNVDPSKATKMYFNVKDRRSADMTLFLSAISDGDYINLHDNGDINDFVAFDSDGKSVLAGSVVTVPVKNYSHAGSLRNGERVYIHWEKIQANQEVLDKLVYTAPDAITAMVREFEVGDGKEAGLLRIVAKDGDETTVVGTNSAGKQLWDLGMYPKSTTHAKDLVVKSMEGGVVLDLAPTGKARIRQNGKYTEIATKADTTISRKATTGGSYVYIVGGTDASDEEGVRWKATLDEVFEEIAKDGRTLTAFGGMTFIDSLTIMCMGDATLTNTHKVFCTNLIISANKTKITLETDIKGNMVGNHGTIKLSAATVDMKKHSLNIFSTVVLGGNILNTGSVVDYSEGFSGDCYISWESDVNTDRLFHDSKEYLALSEHYVGTVTFAFNGQSGCNDQTEGFSNLVYHGVGVKDGKLQGVIDESQPRILPISEGPMADRPTTGYIYNSSNGMDYLATDTGNMYRTTSSGWEQIDIGVASVISKNGEYVLKIHGGGAKWEAASTGGSAGSTFTNPLVLTPATNLDTFKTEGYYENKSKTDLGTVALHYPEDGSLGILKVFADTNLSTKVYQEFMDIKDARFYTRAFDGSAWGQWVLRDLSALKPSDVATVADIDATKPTAEQLGKVMNLYGAKHLVDKAPAHLHGTTVPADTLGKDGDIYFKIK